MGFYSWLVRICRPYIFAWLDAELLQPLSDLAHLPRSNLDGDVSHVELVFLVHGGDALDKMQVQVSERQPSAMSKKIICVSFVDKEEGNLHWCSLHICALPPVKVWPVDLFHANAVGVEVEAPANVAHHDGDVVRLDMSYIYNYFCKITVGKLKGL